MLDDRRDHAARFAQPRPVGRLFLREQARESAGSPAHFLRSSGGNCAQLIGRDYSARGTRATPAAPLPSLARLQSPRQLLPQRWPQYQDLPACWDRPDDRRIPRRRTRHAAARVRREAGLAANESSRCAVRFWPERRSQSATETAWLYRARRHCLEPAGHSKTRSPRRTRQRRSTVSIALRTSVMALVKSLVEMSQHSSRPTITVKRKGFLNRPTDRRVHTNRAIAQVLFSNFSHMSALVIIAAYPSSEYRPQNRLQQSLHRNQFFRCAPFNCDYTQP